MKKTILLLFLLISCTAPSGQVIGEAKINFKPTETIEVTQVYNNDAPAPKAEKTIMQKLLEEAPSQYWYWNGKTGAIINKEKRRELIEKNYKLELGRKRWDTKRNLVWNYNKTMPIQDINFDFYLERPLIRDEMPKSPIDWMQEFQFETPVKVIKSPLMITMPLSKKDIMVNLTLIYKTPEGNVTFYINKVPIKVTAEKTTTYEYGTDIKKGFGREQITTDLFEFAKKEIALTAAEMKEYEKSLLRR